MIAGIGLFLLCAVRKSFCTLQSIARLASLPSSDVAIVSEQERDRRMIDRENVGKCRVLWHTRAFNMVIRSASFPAAVSHQSLKCTFQATMITMKLKG